MPDSVAGYLSEFLRLGSEMAYAERRGYRVVRWTYRQVAETAFRLARELNARQIRKGDRVVIWGPNSGAWVAAFLACAHRGVIAVPMDDGASQDFALRVSHEVNARLLVCSRAHGQEGIPTIFFENFNEQLSRRSGSPYEPEKLISRDALQIVFTSGTTAAPKGVVISHGNVLANVAPLEQQIRPYLKYARVVHPVRFLN